MSGVFTAFLNEDDDDDDDDGDDGVEMSITVRIRTTTNQSSVGENDPQKNCSARGLG